MLLWSRASISKVRHYGFDPAASLRSERLPAGAPQRSMKSEEKQEGCGSLPHSTDPKNGKLKRALSYFPAIFPQCNQNPLRAAHHIFTELDGDALPGGLRWSRQELNINCEWFIAWSLDRPAAQLQLLVGPGLLPGLAAIAWLGQQKPHIRVSVGASRLCHPCWGGNEARKPPPHVRGDPRANAGTRSTLERAGESQQNCQELVQVTFHSRTGQKKYVLQISLLQHSKFYSINVNNRSKDVKA